MLRYAFRLVSFRHAKYLVGLGIDGDVSSRPQIFNVRRWIIFGSLRQISAPTIIVIVIIVAARGNKSTYLSRIFFEFRLHDCDVGAGMGFIDQHSQRE